MKDTSKGRNPFGELDDPALSTTSGGRRFSDIFHDIVGHFSEIIRSEIRLARTEIRQDATEAARASRFLIIGAVLALYAFGFILWSAVYAIANTLPLWASSLIVGVAVGLIAAILLWTGRQKMRHSSLRPDKTIESLQENVTWMKKRTK